MVSITVASEVSTKFKKLLEKENDKNAVFRIYEAKIGGGCKSRMELRVSLDERADADEEQETQVEGMTFVISNDVIDSHGAKFSVIVNENGMPGVNAG